MTTGAGLFILNTRDTPMTGASPPFGLKDNRSTGQGRAVIFFYFLRKNSARETSNIKSINKSANVMGIVITSLRFAGGRKKISLPPIWRRSAATVMVYPKTAEAVRILYHAALRLSIGKPSQCGAAFCAYLASLSSIIASTAFFCSAERVERSGDVVCLMWALLCFFAHYTA